MRILLLMAIPVLLAAAIWLTLPPRAFALDTACAPRGMAASVSSHLYGQRFWKSQLTLVQAELDRLGRLDLRPRQQAEVQRRVTWLSHCDGVLRVRLKG